MAASNPLPGLICRVGQHPGQPEAKGQRLPCRIAESEALHQKTVRHVPAVGVHQLESRPGRSRRGENRTDTGAGSRRDGSRRCSIPASSRRTVPIDVDTPTICFRSSGTGAGGSVACLAPGPGARVGPTTMQRIQALDQHLPQFVERPIEGVSLPAGNVVLIEADVHHRGGIGQDRVDPPVGATSHQIGGGQVSTAAG